MKFSLFTAYFFCLYSAACGFLWIGTGFFPTYPVCALLILVINQTKIRFADEQSVIIFFVSTSMFSVFQHPSDPFLFLPLLLISNPYSVFLGLSSLHGTRNCLSPVIAKPFDHTDLLNELRVFLAKVRKGSKVLFSFDNPGGTYENIFDGYRASLEIIFFIAAEKEVYIFPNWNYIAETNHTDSPDCWGRTSKEVIHNMRRWQADYAIIYTSHDAALASEWREKFEIIAEFNWKEWEFSFQDSQLPWEITKDTPKWHLLQLKRKNEEH